MTTRRLPDRKSACDRDARASLPMQIEPRPRTKETISQADRFNTTAVPPFHGKPQAPHIRRIARKAASAATIPAFSTNPRTIKSAALTAIIRLQRTQASFRTGFVSSGGSYR